MPTRVPFMQTPENHAALIALQDVLHGLMSGARLGANPIFIHGPTGVGKTRVLDQLIDELHACNVRACRWSANDLAEQCDWKIARDADLFIVEDLQHLPRRFVAPLTALIDDRGGPMIFTADAGPGHLLHRGHAHPHRLTDRLAAGLVVTIPPMQTATRRRFLDAYAHQMHLEISPAIRDWLAANITDGARSMAGAIRQLKALQQVRRRNLSLADVQAHWRGQQELGSPLGRIAAIIGDHFSVTARTLASAQRTRALVRARHVGMYLARQLTGLSFAQIGQQFGGRDHKTVQHACAKVAREMKTDAALSGAVRQLRAALH